MKKFLSPRVQVWLVTIGVVALTGMVIYAIENGNSAQNTASTGNDTATLLCKRAHNTFQDTEGFRVAVRNYIQTEVAFRTSQASEFQAVFAALSPKGKASTVGVAIAQLAALAANQGVQDTRFAALIKDVPPPTCQAGS